MNRTQKTIILIAVFCIVAMVIYPPWVLTTGAIKAPRIIPGPYAFICSPPNNARFVDLYRFSIQFGCVILISIGLCLVCKK